MGMFDYVEYEMSCPNCGETVKGFQTKDGERLLGLLQIGEVNTFYSYCVNCGLSITFTRKGPKVLVNDIAHFDMKTEKDNTFKRKKSSDSNIDDYIEYEEMKEFNKLENRDEIIARNIRSFAEKLKNQKRSRTEKK